MSIGYEGQEVALAFGTTSISLTLLDLNIPGWERAVIDAHDLGQSAGQFKKKILAKLKEMPSIDVTVRQDPVLPGTSFSDTEQITITFPDSLGTLTFYGAVSKFSPGNNTTDKDPQDTLTITPTHMNSSNVYQAPSWS